MLSFILYHSTTKKQPLPLYFPGDKIQYFGCLITRDDDDGNNNNNDNKNGETAVGRRTGL